MYNWIQVPIASVSRSTGWVDVSTLVVIAVEASMARIYVAGVTTGSAVNIDVSSYRIVVLLWTIENVNRNKVYNLHA